MKNLEEREREEEGSWRGVDRQRIEKFEREDEDLERIKQLN